MPQDNRSESKSPQEGFNGCWPELKSFLSDNRKREGALALRDPFLEIISKELDLKGKHYLTTIKGLNLQRFRNGNPLAAGDRN